ncbi:ribonuclease H [Trifolium pratense]|uniref:Ribonuclease H n=1 Tax=Trifolium pratense TaxID=57577 RepID=A0A2K3JQL6_TRIPR|nr:ribonuclease H [Trifolium pratense]
MLDVRMSFAEGWRRWIRACVCQSSMSVLVNGRPTKDFSVGKGLRQGDPMSMFVFLIVAEGLSGLMNKAVGSGSFHGYKVNNNLMFHTLQFADDTIIVGEGANPRRNATWLPIIDSMKKRLGV